MKTHNRYKLRLKITIKSKPKLLRNMAEKDKNLWELSF